ncbi:hypothetical protein [Robertkochia solimangrovi]|uniref:hypothetical protein n=1 Tax=Robertkochia solimangrovi TaxID=2213046 RepID=UPI00117F3D29|nr:hypothetical protein [Robertkochia solimangrovi]TRZ45042.1 hypothetical protein DMZ48_04585 [Robertkochia solimangrovi]
MKIRSLILIIVLIAVFSLLFSSCYTVRVRSVYGTPEPDPIGERMDYYRDMNVHEVDTTITIKATDKDFTLLIKNCNRQGIHTLEYRNTFRGILLSAVTFGKKRQVRVKYVCMEEQN